MRVGIVGAGVAGLTVASLLAPRHRITVFEANDYPGGHTHTVDVSDGGRELAVDTGFIVFNDLNYPNLCRLFDALGVRSRDSDMSFSVHCERTGVEWNGSSLGQVFAQRRNLLRPSHWRMLADILRFHREAPVALATLDDETTVDDWVRRCGYGTGFAQRYLLPLGASLWSCDAGRFAAFPMRFVLEFLSNHRMLQIDGRPQWKTVVGGSREYVRALIAPFADRVQLRTPIATIRRAARAVVVHTAAGDRHEFDEVVLACHADQALAMVDRPDPLEREVLGAFPYQRNLAVLHTDTAVLPVRPSARASWNYRIPARPGLPVSVTYDMNRLQGLETDRTWCVTLNPDGRLDPSRIHRRIEYHHPMFTVGRGAAQARHPDLLRRRGLSYCGAYWGYGFHEDAVRSALSVCESFDRDLEAAA